VVSGGGVPISSPLRSPDTAALCLNELCERDSVKVLTVNFCVDLFYKSTDVRILCFFE